MVVTFVTEIHFTARGVGDRLVCDYNSETKTVNLPRLERMIKYAEFNEGARRKGSHVEVITECNTVLYVLFD